MVNRLHLHTQDNYHKILSTQTFHGPTTQPHQFSFTCSRGKTGGLGRVNQVVGRIELIHIFQIIFFFNYKNKSMTIYLERMNKINDNLFRKNE